MQVILRLFLFLLLLLLTLQPASVWANSAVSQAMEAVRTKDWMRAAQLVRREGDVAQDIVEWHRLRAGEGTAREAAAFLARRGDWPGLPLLRKKQEPHFIGEPADRVLSVFGAEGAQTASGALALAGALNAKGRKGEADAEIVLAWRTLAMNDAEQAAYLDQYGRLLRGHHEARLDAMLWNGWKDNSQRMYPLVSDGWRRLAAARLALRQDRTGVDVLIRAVPQRLQDDPGLAFERFTWRARKGRNADASALLLERSKADALGEPNAWGGWRRSLTRSTMRSGAYREAYALATDHGLVEGSSYSDLEWLAGYISLRFLNRPQVALSHFIRFEQSVETPISLGRAGYWIGRAYEAMGDEAAAMRAYAGGGAYQTSFYGLLAAEKAGLPVDAALSGRSSVPDWRGAAFNRSSVHRAALMLWSAGEPSLAERFWVHLAESQDVLGMAQLGAMAIDLKAPHIAVMLGKKFARSGIEMHAPYYPVHPFAARKDLPVPTELALAIARRESEFDPNVVSHANAYGLMQILPGTAQQVAQAIGVDYSRGRLLSDPNYNVTLGTAYLEGLIEEFSGNIVMVAAGYNAGPRRPERWMAERGDPRRRGGPDVIDWIEHIPFTETRNYVMRVAESLPIYRARLGKPPLPQPFSQELQGQSLR